MNKAVQTTDVTQLTGIVDTLFFSSPTFSAGKLKTTGNGLVSFAVKQLVELDAQVTLHGKWDTHPKYGKQFNADSAEYDLILDTEGLALWLQKNRQIRGIGPSKAKLIAQTFGESFDEVITKTPERIAEAAKLSADSIEILRHIWFEHREHARLITWLAKFGLSIREITAIKGKYGQGAMAVLTANPYILIGDIPRFAFKTVDRIALKMGIEKAKIERIEEGILFCVRLALESGNTYVDLDSLLSRANTLLELDTLDSKERIERAVRRLIEERRLGVRTIQEFSNEPRDDSSRTDKVVDRELIFSLDILRMEESLATTFLEHRNALNPHFSGMQLTGSETIKSLADKVGLNPLQTSALDAAITHLISLISGGAGTGKTYTIQALLKLYDEQGLTCLLAAPTGKAARRMEETTGRQAYTIHRLLDYHPYEGWRINRDNPLQTDLVIIDEFSMIDVPLAWHLCDAIDFSRTALIIVGDHNQLPPVGPGNVLRDLIDSGALATTILKEVVRQAGPLKLNSTRILEGVVEKTTKAVSKNGDTENVSVPWQLVNKFTDATSCRSYLLETWEKIITNYPELNLIRDIQVLTPQKERDLGTKSLNIELQRITQRVRYRVEVEPRDIKARTRFCLHDKVIQTKNDYELDVMNGQIGQVVEVLKEGEIVVAFEGIDREITIPSERVNNLMLAYVLTIHKAQGSEFPMVIAVIHKSHCFMHHRNLFYTAVTRAKRKVVIVGDRWGIENCAKTKQTDKRLTWLGRKLLDRD